MKRNIVSIVVSVFNEENNVLQLYREVVSHLLSIPDLRFEIIYVNDGSTDKSLGKMRSIQEQDKRVKVVNLMRNFGHEVAMTAGMDYASGEAVIFMDGDLQHPPSLLTEMIRLWHEGVDVVLTRRVDTQGKTRIREFNSNLYYSLLNFLSDVPIPKKFPDFRLIDRKFIDVIKQMDERDRMFRGLINWIGVSNFKVVDFSAPERFSGHSKYNFRKLLRLGIDGVVSFSTKPLKLASYLGVCATLFSMILAIRLVVDHFINDRPETGFATLICSVLGLGSVQLLVLGILGEYIGRIHIEVKNRPLYVAEFISGNTITLSGRNHHYSGHGSAST